MKSTRSDESLHSALPFPALPPLIFRPFVMMSPVFHKKNIVCIALVCLSANAWADMPVWLEAESGLVRQIMPGAVYVYGAATKAHLTYGGGVEWVPSDWYGFGLEYRQAPVRMATSRQRGTLHIAGIIANAGTHADWRIRLRAEIGAGVLLGEAKNFKMDPSWAAGARLGAGWRVFDRISAMAWVGAVQTGRVNTSEGYFLPTLMPDYGIGVKVGL